MRYGEDAVEERMMLWVERHWRTAFWLLFAGACAYFLYYKWGQIRWLALSDTDDNMRLAEVKAWLGGQGWFDLRQHKLAPPEGLNIHWSRIVDLPIAALILIFKPLVGDFTAQRIACAVAPMLAFGPALWAMIVTVRRIVHPRAYPIAFAILMCAQTSLFMWMPLRIDHHGWQLAMLLLVIAGLADPNGRRGGATAGVSLATVRIGNPQASRLGVVVGFGAKGRQEGDSQCEQHHQINDPVRLLVKVCLAFHSFLF